MRTTFPALLSLLSLVISSEFSLAQSTRFCIGEKRCPVPVRMQYPCESDADSIAEQLCTVRLGGGQTRVLPHQLLKEGIKAGRKSYKAR